MLAYLRINLSNIIVRSQGWYWALWHKMSTNRTYFYWKNESEFTPKLDWASSQYRMRVRYVHDVE